MGNCISYPSSNILETKEGCGDLVLCEENAVSNGILKLGSVFSQQGSKGLNQDAAIVYQDYGVEDGAFCGVFDGHGQNGHLISKTVKNRLPSLLLKQKIALTNINGEINYNNFEKYNETVDGELISSENYNAWKKACTNAFKVMDKEIKLTENLDCSYSGTTAVVIVKQDEELIIANLGDSRAILGTMSNDAPKVVQLTTDLKPSLPTEADRIRNCNGRVFALKEEPHIQRVWLPLEDSPGLAMSRAIGDTVLKAYGVTATPDVSYRRLTSNDQFLVLATDGVWDVLSNEEVASVVWSADSETAAAKAVVDAATAAWKHRFPSAKRDDITAVCLFLQKSPPMFPVPIKC